MSTTIRCVWVLVVMLLTACAHVEPTMQNDRMRDVWNNPSSHRHVRVRGIGIAPKMGGGTALRRGAAREAALASAKKELLALVGGTRLTGGITVKDAMVIDSELRESVDRLVFGAEEALVEWDSSDNCVVTLQVERAEVEKIVAGTKPKDLPEPLPEPTRRLWKSQREAEDRGQPSEGPVRGYSPNRALVLGLLFPGAGQLYAQGPMDGGEGARTLFKGLGIMGGTLGLVGAGVDKINKDKADKKARTSGLICVGLGVALHLYGALDAKYSLERALGPVALDAAPGWYGARYTWRY